MKLGEALNERARLAKGIADKRDLMEGSIILPENEKPAVDAAEMIVEIEADIDAISSLVERINTTNAQTFVEPGLSLTKALAERDRLGARFKFLDFVLRKAAGVDHNSYFRRDSETPDVRTVNVADMRAARDLIAAERRALDAKIQATNWTCDLL